jgi:hypothetical protein
MRSRRIDARSLARPATHGQTPLYSAISADAFAKLHNHSFMPTKASRTFGSQGECSYLRISRTEEKCATVLLKLRERGARHWHVTRLPLTRSKRQYFSSHINIFNMRNMMEVRNLWDYVRNKFMTCTDSKVKTKKWRTLHWAEHLPTIGETKSAKC